ncbi:MAG: SpoIIE family protein phosphatase [Mogibacterium sp.]|nr:SpoIIE family protein phosphatase [Mogibacterium sp.]
MNDLSLDIGTSYITHYGEQLCGDHYELVNEADGVSKVIVLADGLKSGVKASILSTLTAKMLSTMVASGLSIEESVRAVAATLPISSEHGVAYSTFTVMRFVRNTVLELTQYENPEVTILRDGERYEYKKVEQVIDGKVIITSRIRLQEGDIIVAVSDGCPGANDSLAYNHDWDLPQIADFVSTMSIAGYSAKALAGMLVDECNRLYGGKPIDDASACVIRVVRRQQVNVLFGPPADRNDCNRMLTLFCSKAGKRIVCGGTTAKIAADYLGTTVRNSTKYKSAGGPPMSEIDGIDLVTEGLVTIDQVVRNAAAYLENDDMHWSTDKDAASLICRMLFEEATDVNFFVGRAVNPATENLHAMSYSAKSELTEELANYLRKMGKNVKISYF